MMTPRATESTRASNAPRAIAASLLAALALLGCSDGSSDETASDDTTDTSAPPDTVDGSQSVESPLEAAAGTPSEPSGDGWWPSHGHDLGSQRSNGFDDTVGPAEAPELVPVWQADDLRAVTGTPAVVDGVAYVGAWTGEVLALDAATGEQLWATEVDGPPAGSPAVTAEAVYVASEKTSYRLDRETGEVEWSVVPNDHAWTRLYAGPIVVDGLVIQPVAGVQIAVPQEDYDFRGNVVALDEATGEEVWRVYISQDDETSGAGGSVWAGASADPDRSLVFVGTGNTLEEPTAPLADSIVAIDYTTGEIAWSTQFTDPDVYNMPGANDADGPDADVGSTPTLWSVGDRDLVGAGDKAGTFYALDRDTGAILWETQLTPGSRLGGIIGGSAFADGRIFVASNVGDEAAGVPTGVSRMFALDAGTGEILWQTDMELAVFGPAAVANGVVYQGTGAPAMNAFDAETGEMLFTHEPPGPVGGGASVADGRVYWGFGYWVIQAAEEQLGGIIAFGLPG